jgi:endonuclease YncB( thermonuclease family)
MKTTLRGLTASLVAIGVFLAIPYIAVGQPAAGGHAPVAVTVIDGDTLRFGSVVVRLWGIDAPEMDEMGGAEAKAFLRGLVFYEYVICRPRAARDRYGRIVAQCFAGSLDIARALIKTGHARDWPRYSGGYYAK